MSLFIPGPLGPLEARLWKAEGEPRAAAVFCHPHPLHGGTMHSTPVFRVARALQTAGAAVLRFNFRGVGRSAGTHHGAGGEVEDARAALDWLAGELSGAPLWAGGFSFGARTAATLALSEPRLARVVLIAMPVLAYDCSFLDELRAPGLICQAGEDEFGNLAALRARHPALDPRLELREVPGADHFFHGHVDELQAIVSETATRWIG
jgi:alpha/beta superfamily hydrolase